MKRLLTKLLLALLLVVNPVAVLASDFHADDHAGSNAAEMAVCHSADEKSELESQTQHDNTDCEMPCCQEVSCLSQSTCVIHFGSALLAQQAVRLYSTIGHSHWDSLISNIPERELPPDNPPPILV